MVAASYHLLKFKMTSLETAPCIIVTVGLAYEFDLHSNCTYVLNICFALIECFEEPYSGRKYGSVSSKAFMLRGWIPDLQKPLKAILQLAALPAEDIANLILRNSTARMIT